MGYLESIPDRSKMSAKEWEKWCEDRGFDCLGNHAGSRGAWVDDLGMYIRNNTHLLYADGVLIDLINEEDAKP